MCSVFEGLKNYGPISEIFRRALLVQSFASIKSLDLHTLK